MNLRLLKWVDLFPPLTAVPQFETCLSSLGFYVLSSFTLFSIFLIINSDTKKACPAYPTELVFGLDMTVEGTFQRQQNALLSLLKDISIAESNCPTGARVAVVGYNSVTKYLIRFQDYRRKAQLIEAVKNIRLETTTNERSLGAAMHFVGRNVFKHTRAGALMRKVAVFFTNGKSEDKDEIVTAVMEYRGLNIIPAVISLENALNVREAMEVSLIC